MKQTWKKLNSKVVYRHPYWQVRQDRVIKPDGVRDYYYYVDVRDFVAVVALTNDKKSVYLVRQYRYPTQQYSWEIPEGLIERREQPLRAAQRELEEEAGVRARRWKKIGTVSIANGLTCEKCFLFIAQDLQPGTQSLESGEADMIVKVFSIKKIEAMITTGQIDDAATIVAVHLLGPYLKKL